MYVGFCALAASIAANGRRGRRMIIHLLVEDGYEPDVASLARRFASLEFQVHTVSDQLFRAPSEETLSRAIYYRLLLPDVLSGTDKVVYLDCDVIVLRDIGDLFDIPLAGYAVAAVPDYSLDYQTRSCGVPWQGLAVNLASYVKHVANSTVDTYFNSGVMVMDLAAWRRDGIAAKCFDRIKIWPDTRFADQDTLNAVVTDYLRLDCRWNAFSHFVLSETPKRVDEAWAAIVDLWTSDPWIVHFAGAGKPWSSSRSTRYSQLFWAFAKDAGYRRPEPLLGIKSNAPGTPNAPLVSVVIVNHNYGSYLEQCVRRSFSRTIRLSNASSSTMGRRITPGTCWRVSRRATWI